MYQAFEIFISRLTDDTVLVMMKADRVGRMIAACASRRGKSVLQRARNRGNPGTGQPVGKGHRNIPPARVRVKWWCKRPPGYAAMHSPGNPFREQGQTEVCWSQAAHLAGSRRQPQVDRVDRWSSRQVHPAGQNAAYRSTRAHLTKGA